MFGRHRRRAEADHRRRVVALGRLSGEKGFDNLIAAFHRVSVAHPEWSLVIAGEAGVFTMPDGGPTFVVVGTISKINKGNFGYELNFKIDPIKTLPNAPDAAIISVNTKTPVKSVKKGGKKRYLITAPKTCKKTWAYQGEFTFVNGQKASVDGTTKCKK